MWDAGKALASLTSFLSLNHKTHRMKRLFTILLSGFLFISPTIAQDFPLEFVDEAGNVVADGTVLTLDKPEAQEDEFDDGVMISSGLSVRNTSSVEVVCGTEYSISAISNGVFQTCFPLNCMMRKETGSWVSETGTLGAGVTKSMMTEWFPESAGKLDAEFQLLKYKLNPITNKYTLESRGPKVTLNFIFNPDAIRSMDKAENHISSVTYFTLDGRQCLSPSHGTYIMKVKYSNGVCKTSKHVF